MLFNTHFHCWLPHIQGAANLGDGHALLAQKTSAILLDHPLIGPEVGDTQGLEIREGARVVGSQLVDAVGVIR